MQKTNSLRRANEEIPSMDVVSYSLRVLWLHTYAHIQNVIYMCYMMKIFLIFSIFLWIFTGSM